ncbi:MAG: hypothetical protein WC639_03180 [Patescibacteria group bacterium]|jgi:hypothetical protein
MDYSKYYDLEKYIFGEVHDNFLNHGYLTAQEFFCIVIWKANRAKSKIKNRVKTIDSDLDVAVKKITNQIFNEKENKVKLKILIDYGFALPMASAILTVLYPDIFTVYDIRVRNEIGMEKDISYKKDAVNLYFAEYLKKVMAIAGSSLRDRDKYLWGKSFYDDLKKLLM